MICEDCADRVDYHPTKKCIHCRDLKIKELEAEIKELMSGC